MAQPSSLDLISLCWEMATEEQSWERELDRDTARYLRNPALLMHRMLLRDRERSYNLSRLYAMIAQIESARAGVAGGDEDAAADILGAIDQPRRGSRGQGLLKRLLAALLGG